MRIAQFAIIASLAAASALLSCAASDTIVALNVSSSDIGPVSALNVTVTQGAQAPFTDKFTPPSVPTDDAGATTLAPAFFERIKLPDGFAKATATVAADALDESGKAFLSTSTTVTIEPQGAVAAFVIFALPPDGGSEDGGSEDGGPDGGPDGGGI